MSNYLQVEIEEVELVHKELGKTSRWKYAAGLGGAGVCLLLLSLSLWTTSPIDPSPVEPVQKPWKPPLEVAKDMGVMEFLDLFLDGVEDGQSTFQHGSVNSSMISTVRNVKRQLQDMTQNPLALPIASCTVDTYLVASFIGILGNIINGANKGCKTADKTRTVFKISIFKDLLPNVDALISPREKFLVRDLLDQGCRIGIETAVSIVLFIAGFLARAVSDCATAIQLSPNPGASCAGDVSLVSAGISYLTAGQATAQAVCPPYPRRSKGFDFDIDAEALDIVRGLSRRLGIRDRERNPLLAAKVDDVKEVLIKRLPALGPIAKTILNNRAFFKRRREKRKNQGRTDKLVKCGFDAAGVVGFAAAVGVFITAGTLECPVAIGDSAQAQGLKMGCSLDISATIAALTTIAGFMGILATECPEDPESPAVNLCVTAGFNIVSSLGFMSGALSDAVRTCGAA